jgi:hypothetical protein
MPLLRRKHFEDVSGNGHRSRCNRADVKSTRRDFLRLSGLALGALGVRTVGTGSRGGIVSIIADPDDPVASSPSCRWAQTEISQALERRAVKVGEFASLQQAPPNSFCIVASAADHGALAATALRQAGLVLSTEPESLALVPFSSDGRRGILACGDAPGLLYALLELADCIQHSDGPLATLEQQPSIAERPFNSIRSIGRLFCSDIQDKPWFYDRQMWPAYFSMLAAQRFNRFSLNFGIGYDSLDDVRDAYLLFAYPFLLAVPGYNVRAINLPDQERDRNLEMLRFISTQAVAHGLDFQLGIWTHGYRWGPASKPNYTISGITPQNHAAYSRAALTALLKACPDISGVTLRTHGESGVREGDYSFWSTVFSALPASGRRVNLDLHTKGLNQDVIDEALKTGMPLTLSPKYWAEHMGLPYQQASIRELEMPDEHRNARGFFELSNGSRSFTRYGYADFLREDRPYRVMFRIWPGSHRLLLWGDPAYAAAHARAFAFCGCDGSELYEPLSFKGRRGSGSAGSRCAYADTSLNPHWDWQKYLYTYRSWGRVIYNPDASPDAWQRDLRTQFRAAAPAMEAAFASATPITQIITTAHLPSAANDAFSPEYYTNQSIVDASLPSPYFDTPKPPVFGNVSPLDPQLFSTINEFTTELLKKERSGKYSPLEVAQWLDAAAEATERHLHQAEARVLDKQSPEFRRAAIDLGIEIGIARFFAAKFRSGVLYAAYEQSGDRAALEGALKQYRRARDFWQDFAGEAHGAYLSDITFGPMPYQRANWLDRLPAVDKDIAEMRKRLDTAPSAASRQPSLSLRDLTVPSKRGSVNPQHTAPSSFTPGERLELTAVVPPAGTRDLAIRLYYRHVDQAERYRSKEMQENANRFSATIPADYTDSPYPLQYYFEIRSAADGAWLFPGLGDSLRSQPYFVVRSASHVREAQPGAQDWRKRRKNDGG